MTNTRVLMIVGMVLLTLSATVIAGCTGEPPKGPVSPGIEFAALGGAEVIGYLANTDGVWTVLDAEPNEGEESEVLATLVPGSVDETGIEALDGRYIWAAGSANDEGDVPEIKVDGIDTAVEP